MLDIAHLSATEKVGLQEFIDRILLKFRDKIVLIRLYGSKDGRGRVGNYG